MLGSYLKSKFGGDKEVPAAEQFYSPLRIGLHTTITVKTVDWIIMKEQLNTKMVLPSSSLKVMAIGEMKTADDIIYQIYLMDDSKEEFVLQLFCSDDKTVAEATLFRQVVSIIPLSESEWDDNLDGIGHRILELDEKPYERIWGEGTEQIDLIEFTENIVEADKSTSYTNSYLLYGRKFESLVGTEETEMLLVGVEETGETAEITMMLGLSVPLQNIEIQ